MARLKIAASIFAVLIVSSILLIVNVQLVKADSLLDSYSVGDTFYIYPINAVHPSGGGGYYSVAGQAFAGQDATITRVDFEMQRGGSLTGKVRAALYLGTGTMGVNCVPTGSALAVSSEMVGNSIPTSWGLVEFSLSYQIYAGLNYCIVVQGSSPDFESAVRVAGDSTSPSHYGNPVFYDSAWEYATNDIYFYLYGDLTPSRSVSVSVSPSWNYGYNGDNVTYTVTVTNTGDVADNYSLTPLDTEGWAKSVSPSSLTNVASGENRTATLTLTIPIHAIGGTNDYPAVFVQGTGDNATSVNVVARVYAVWATSVSISPSSRSGVNGALLSYTVTVNNLGNFEENHALTTTDNAGWSPTISPTSLFIAAFSSGTATLSVTIPDSAIGGTIDNITATATQVGASGSSSCTAQVSVVKGVHISSISPSLQSGINGATLDYTVTIHNTGNATDNYSISATDNYGWSLSVASSIIIGPDNSNSTILHVTIPDNAPNNTHDNITVTVTDSTTSDSSSCTAVNSSHSGPSCQIISPPNGYTTNPNITVYFTGMALDNENDNLDFFTFSWDFGDNSTSTEINPTHSYTAIGSYHVVLIVSNGYGVDTNSITITINHPTPGPSGGPSWVPAPVNKVVQPYTNVLFRSIMMIGPFSLNLFWVLVIVIILAWRFERGGKGKVKGIMWSAILLLGFMFVFGANLGIL